MATVGNTLASADGAVTPRAAGLPQPGDLLVVQRADQPHRTTVADLGAAVLVPATATTIGAIRPGTNLSVDPDGTLHAAIPGALHYRGAIDPTTAEAPADPMVGDVYLASASGVALTSWSGIAGEAVAQGDLLLFDGSSWSANAALGPDGAGVIRILVTAPLQVEESDPAQPQLSVALATTEAAGVVQRADAAAVEAGTAARVVDAAQLRAVAAALMPLDLSTLPPLPA